MHLSTNHGAEGVGRIILHRLKGVQLVASWLLVGVESDVISLREIIRIHSHTLKEVGTIDGDTDLSVIRSAERQILNITSKFDDSVHIRAALWTIANLKSLAGNCSRLLDTVHSTTPVLNIDTGGFNFAPLGQNRLVVHAWRHQDLHFGEFTSRLLLDLHLVDVVALSLKHGSCSLHLGACNTHVDLNAESDVKKTVLAYLLLELLSKRLSTPRPFFEGGV